MALACDPSILIADEPTTAPRRHDPGPDPGPHAPAQGEDRGGHRLHHPRPRGGGGDRAAGGGHVRGAQGGGGERGRPLRAAVPSLHPRAHGVDPEALHHRGGGDAVERDPRGRAVAPGGDRRLRVRAALRLRDRTMPPGGAAAGGAAGPAGWRPAGSGRRWRRGDGHEPVPPGPGRRNGRRRRRCRHERPGCWRRRRAVRTGGPRPQEALPGPRRAAPPARRLGVRGRRGLVRDPGGGDPRARGGERVRQVHGRKVHPAPHRPDGRAGRAERRGRHPRPRPPAAVASAADADGLPGPLRVAQPAALGRDHRRRAATQLRRGDEEGGPRPGRRALRAGGP